MKRVNECETKNDFYELIAQVWEEWKMMVKWARRLEIVQCICAYTYTYIVYIWSTEAICICDVRGQTKHVSIRIQQEHMHTHMKMDSKAKKQTIDTILI